MPTDESLVSFWYDDVEATFDPNNVSDGEGMVGVAFIERESQRLHRSPQRKQKKGL